jgi:hypothetical protein
MYTVSQSWHVGCYQKENALDKRIALGLIAVNKYSPLLADLHLGRPRTKCEESCEGLRYAGHRTR